MIGLRICRSISLIILFIFFISAVSVAGDQCGSNRLIELRNLRIGLNGEVIRIVADLSGKCNYQVYTLDDSSKIQLDIFDAVLSNEFRIHGYRPDKLLNRCTVKEANFRQVDVEIPLVSGLPIDSVKVSEMDDPFRIVIDIRREHHKVSEFHVTKNILWRQVEWVADGYFTLINELQVNQKSPDVSVAVALAKNYGKNCDSVCKIVEQSGAIAGVNGGYFSKDGKNLGLVVIDKKIVASSIKKRPPRTAFAIDANKNILFNRVTDVDGALKTKWGKPWKDVLYALGAGPRLMSGDVVHITDNDEGLGKGGNDITRRAGRSTLGVDRRGNLVLMTASGYRDNHKDGIKLLDLANYMKSRGVVDGMNLDGGGSTAMSILGTHVSRSPGQGKFQRPVANAILVFDKSPVISPRTINIDPAVVEMPADGVSKKIIKAQVTDGSGNPVPDKTQVAVASGLGLFEKKYYPVKDGIAEIRMRSIRAPGNYTFRIDCGPARKFIPVKLEAGCPKEIFARVIPLKNVDQDDDKEKDKNDSSQKPRVARYIIEVLIRDEYGNPLGGKVVEFEVSDGKGTFSTNKCFTRPRGVADTTFTLESSSAKIKISSQDLEPLDLEIKR
jgi:exopolysaccharide biosynthesis protein